ncbi:DMT family transporter [Brevibacillus ginsengisoli]|uniref:DMT family transporter n=1 Tax=Brevibacillus ginsengisoli TaxID=363854 RepID=UPI003CF012C7
MNKSIGMLVLAVALWGTTVAPSKWAMEDVHPFTLTFLRLSIASLFFMPYAWFKAVKTNGRPNIAWKRISMLSFTGVSGYFLLNYYGLSMTSGVNSGILNASLPLFTIVLAAIYLKEQIRIPQWIGLILGLAGVIVISVHPSEGNGSSLWGDLLILASCFVWAIYVVQMKRPGEEAELPSELFTALTFMLGACMLIPFTAFEIGMYGLPDITQKLLVSVAFLAAGPTIAAYWLWNKALESVSAARAGVYLNTLPLISVLTAILLLGESVSWRTVVGGILILGGVLWAERKKAVPLMNVHEQT